MINIIAVFIIAGIYFVLGWLWYSPVLFGKMWMNSINKKPEDLQMGAKEIIGSIVISIIMPMFFAILLELVDNYNIITGILISLIIWVGFVAPFELYAVFYVGKSFKTYLIDIFYHLAGLLIAGIILSLWQI